MGQKIHPLGFRVGITKRHQAEWYARFHKHQYAQTVLEDRLLRETLAKLLPDLLKKQLKSSKDLPKISHIKIERGLIPYEITIQIHAENCQLIKASIDHLELPNQLLANSFRTRVLLEQAAKIQNLSTSLPSSGLLNEPSKQNFKTEQKFTRFSKTSKFKQKTLQHNFRQRFLENLMIFKKGETVTRKFKNQPKLFNQSELPKRRQGNSAGLDTRKQGKFGKLRKSSTPSVKLNFVNSPKVSRFASLFVNKVNLEFSTILQSQMKEWNQFLNHYKEQQVQKYGRLKYAPIGYSKKWSLNNLKKLQKKPLPILVKLLKALQKQALLTMENLRQDFVILGTISKTKSFHYFQQIRFIKQLRKLITEIQVQQNSLISGLVSTKKLNSQRTLQRRFEKSLVSLSELALTKKLTNIEDESRKAKLIDYLQNVVQHHRQENIYLYLATIADAKKYLKKIQRFTKEQVNFLFGLNFNSLNQVSEDKKQEFIKNQVMMTLKQAKSKNELQTKLQDVFVKQFQKQRLMCLQNIQLNPKISLKFYSVKPETLITKANIVADSIVDSLEKRQAFRRVIKKSKEDLMKTSKVKGVKIQVAGRLNGAEIARSEWVRAGRVPLQTLSANIDYSYKTAQTIYGIIGVKVWIYKGYTKTVNKTEKAVNFFPVTN